MPRNSARNAEASRERISLDRALACRVTDLDVYFHGQLVDGQVRNMSDGDDPEAKIRITTSSDDLVAIVDGTLNAAAAWASGRVKIEAGVFDLLEATQAALTASVGCITTGQTWRRKPGSFPASNHSTSADITVRTSQCGREGAPARSDLWQRHRRPRTHCHDHRV